MQDHRRVLEPQVTASSPYEYAIIDGQFKASEQMSLCSCIALGQAGCWFEPWVCIVPVSFLDDRHSPQLGSWAFEPPIKDVCSFVYLFMFLGHHRHSYVALSRCEIITSPISAAEPWHDALNA